MSARPILIPDENHPITITPSDAPVTVSVGGHQIARSTRALALAEAAYPVVQYLPLADVDPAVLHSSETHTYCPYKGEASYYSVRTPEGTEVQDAVWFYPEPYQAVEEIAGHVAFYADRVDIALEG